MLIKRGSNLLERNQYVGYKVPVVKSAVSELTTSTHNPYRPVTATNLIKFLFYLHEKRNWRPPRSFNTYYPEAKELLTVLGPEDAEEMMLKAYGKAKHPWGFNFILKMRGKQNGPNFNSFTARRCTKT